MSMPNEFEVVKVGPASHAAVELRLPDVGQALRNFVSCREVGEFLSGALAGAMTKAVLAPLETIRTRMVVGVGSRHIAGSFLQVVEENGWQGLWAGNTVNMLRIIPTQAIELATFECVKRTVTSAHKKWKEEGNPKVQVGHLSMELPCSWISPIAVGGAAAGFVSTLICHPLEVIKVDGSFEVPCDSQNHHKWLGSSFYLATFYYPDKNSVNKFRRMLNNSRAKPHCRYELLEDRLTVNREIYPSISIAFRKICKDDGVGGLYAGIFPTLAGMFPYSTCYYFMYETVKSSYCRSKKKKNLNRAEMILIGAISGFTASTISFPLEVARKRLMIGKMHGKCPANMVACLAEVVREEGLLGLYRGWGASCLKVMPSSGITWMFYEAWKDVLLLDKFKQ